MYYIGSTEIKPYVKINRKDQENFGSSYFNLIEIGTSICSPIFYIPRQRTINRGANGSSKLSLIFHAYIQSIGADTDALTGMRIMKCIINHAVSHTLSFGKLFSALTDQ